MDRKRILTLFGIAWVSAALLTWFLYARTVAPKAEKTVTALAAARNLPAGTRLQKSDIRKINSRQDEVIGGTLTDEKQALDHVLLFPMVANEPLSATKISAVTDTEGIPSTIDAGKRAISVPISDVSGVAGLISPGSRVDVLFTRPGSMAEAVTAIVLQDVKVLSIGKVTQPNQPVDPKAPKAQVATLVVSPEEAAKLELAKNQGKISLLLRNPSDRGQQQDPAPVTTEVLDPFVSARLARARQGRTTQFAGKVPNLDDPRVWEELTGQRKPQDRDRDRRAEEDDKKKKEAEKPKTVVDVFKGDRHTQEIFR